MVNRDLSLANLRRYIAISKEEEAGGKGPKSKRNKNIPAAALAAAKESKVL